MLFNLCYYMFSCLGTLNIFSIKRVLNCVEKISSLEHIRSAFKHTKNNKNMFHVAANRRDLSMLQLMWNFARPRLSDKELEDLLLVDADNLSIIQNVASKGFTKHPPCILNTNCRTAAFEFIPFKFGDSIPEMAVRINGKSVTYIGRCLYSNTDDYELCKIMPKAKEQVETIGYDDLGKKVAGDTFEILVGKGFGWICGGKPGQDFFEFRNHYLEKNDNDDDVSLVMLTSSGKNYLAYDDDTLISSFVDDVETGIFYNHRNKLQNDILY